MADYRYTSMVRSFYWPSRDPSRFVLQSKTLGSRNHVHINRSYYLGLSKKPS